MKLSGKVWKYSADLGATALVSAKYDELGMSRQYAECAKHVLEDLDPAFAQAVRPGDLLVAGRNLGNGHAHYYMAAIMGCKLAGLSGLWAEGVNRLFQRAAIDTGLPVWEFPGLGDLVETGHQLEINLATGAAHNLTTGVSRRFKPLPTLILDILGAGGSLNWALRRVHADHAIA